MSGRLIYLMGPSGSGKDTILDGLCRMMGSRGYLTPRVITRPETDTERNAISVSDAEFIRLERSGALALAWRANGLAYGVPDTMNERLAAGCDVLLNGSREYLPEAHRRYPRLVPVLLTVDEDTLRSRLVARDRETLEQIQLRLDRNAHYTRLADSAKRCGALIVLDNSGAAEDAIRTLYHYLYPFDITGRHTHAADLTGYGKRGTSPGL